MTGKQARTSILSLLVALCACSSANTEPDGSEAPVLRVAGDSPAGSLFITELADGPRLMEVVDPSVASMISVYREFGPPCLVGLDGADQLAAAGCSDDEVALAQAYVSGSATILDDGFRYSRTKLGGFVGFGGLTEQAPDQVLDCDEYCIDQAEKCLLQSSNPDACYDQYLACLAVCSVDEGVNG
jgi:hypothetical protein